MKQLRTFYAVLFLALFSYSITPASAERLKVLTLNTWGVSATVWDKWRYAAAMTAIEKLNPDIIVLDELFSAQGKRDFQSELYPYVADGGNWFPRLAGSGTRILSKYPYDMHAILTYHACASSDCLSRKGSTLTTITLPSGKKINVAGTHLNSAGDDNVRTDQLRQLKIFTDTYADPAAPLLVVGDFNFGPTSPAYQYARNELQVTDSWTETHTDGDLGLTYDVTTNHYAREYCIKTHDKMVQDRIDFMFHRGAITPLSTQVIFNTPDELFSDHYGLIAEYEI